MEKISFGEVIKNLRKEKKLSIRKASEGIGISHTYLDSLEKGYDPRTRKKRYPTPNVIRKISNFYKYPYGKLMNAAGYTGTNWVNKISKRLKELRLESGLSVEEVANRAPHLDPWHITRIEQGFDSDFGYVVVPSENRLSKILNVYGVDLDNFIEEIGFDREKLPSPQQESREEIFWLTQSKMDLELGNFSKISKPLDLHKLFIQNEKVLDFRGFPVELELTYKDKELTDEDLEDIKQLLKIKFKD